MFPDTGPRRLDASIQTRQHVFEKHCRIARMYGNEPSGVSRTCSWAPCGSPVIPIGRQPTCNAIRGSTRAWILARALPTRRVGLREDRPRLQQALASTQPGDGLIVWRLDRLGRSLPHLLPIVTTLQAQVDSTKVQELLGHCHVTTTQIYEKRRFHTSEGASHDFPISCCAPPLPRELGGAAPYDTKT